MSPKITIEESIKDRLSKDKIAALTSLITGNGRFPLLSADVKKNVTNRGGDGFVVDFTLGKSHANSSFEVGFEPRDAMCYLVGYFARAQQEGLGVRLTRDVQPLDIQLAFNTFADFEKAIAPISAKQIHLS